MIWMKMGGGKEIYLRHTRKKPCHNQRLKYRRLSEAMANLTIQRTRQRRSRYALEKTLKNPVRLFRLKHIAMVTSDQLCSHQPDIEMPITWGLSSWSSSTLKCPGHGNRLGWILSSLTTNEQLSSSFGIYLIFCAKLCPECLFRYEIPCLRHYSFPFSSPGGAKRFFLEALAPSHLPHSGRHSKAVHRIGSLSSFQKKDRVGDT